MYFRCTRRCNFAYFYRLCKCIQLVRRLFASGWVFFFLLSEIFIPGFIDLYFLIKILVIIKLIICIGYLNKVDKTWEPIEETSEMLEDISEDKQ